MLKTSVDIIKSILKEPLVHFFIIGLLIFVVYEVMNKSDNHEVKDSTVVLTENDIQWFRETWRRQWHREPDLEDMQGLVRGYLKEKLLAEEARALGLDQDDTIIRRRLALKMEFLLKNSTEIIDPDESTLKKYYSKQANKYKASKKISFKQVFFKEQQDAEKIHKSLLESKHELLGHSSILPDTITEADEREVDNIFGKKFSDSIFKLESGRWHGPIASSYGFHYIFISTDQAPREQSYADVSSKVLEQWRQEQNQKLEDQLIASLLKKHKVVLDEKIHDLVNPVLLDLQ